MKNSIVLLVLIAGILGAQCKQNAPKPSGFAAQLSTELENVSAARQTISDALNQVNALRTAINNIPESVKADTSSGFADLQRRVELFESKTSAMLVMYDRIVPELRLLNDNVQAGILSPEDAKIKYETLEPTFHNYSIGVEGTKKLLATMQDEARRLSGQ